MKCVRCGAQSNYRERQAVGGACKACRKAFAFEPRSDPITDLAFQNAIAVVSDGGRLAWLERQLYYEVARRVRRRRLWHRLTRRRCVSLDGDRFASLLGRWIAVNGSPPGRLAPGAFAEDVRSEARAPDAGEYAFERLVLCDDDEIADVLLANGFHADHKCAVLSVNGYPTWAFELLIPRLRESPPTTVLVLHDADPAGCCLAAEVKADPRWFGVATGVNVVDAGLRPVDATRFRGVYLPGSPIEVLTESASVAEAQWLSKYRLELKAVRPRALLAVLAEIFFRGDADEPRESYGDDGWWGAGAWGDGSDDDVG
jgi:hypothetical protein